MLDYCAAHNITSDVEVIPIQQINEAWERTIKGQVKYRFSDRYRILEERVRDGALEAKRWSMDSASVGAVRDGANK